ncbi:MAG: cupin domain-containing protein [Bacteroidales bacterium]|nr:cupin domain-containing protein [Bacteroidales bacterium]
MKIKEINKTEKKNNPHGIDARLLYDKDEAQTVHITLQAGESLKPHITPVNVFFYILEGEPTILIDKEKQIVKKDCLVESPKDIPHCIYNNSKNVVKVLVVKVPKPTKATKIL